jgi:hypothetical protein
MRSMFITISVVALLASSAVSAAARTDGFYDRTDAGSRAGAMSTSARSASEPTRAPIVRTARPPVGRDGFEWADAGIGAGVALALLLGVAGMSSVRRHPTMTAH